MKVLDSIKNEVKEIMDNDSAHDFEHIMRVYKNAQKMCKKEKANKKLVLCAALLHDIVSYPKSDKRSKMSSIESAKKSKTMLKKYNFSEEEIIIISDAIRDHSFSQNKIPSTLEGKILQDADRLDAIGAIGLARVFATGGSLKRPFYNIDDPFCKTRKPDDKTWTVDHFYQKLLKLESLMNTKSGKIEAKKRTRVLKDFLKQLKLEI
ncbi:phosphohydrolase [Nitrosopumilus cobalaminigenes]|uniref:Phosphohydrolase n=1 Tax=Nitrosopumilus cobalaminigenes TaxID=1470066 RepID=A0A7D5M1V7_9ARCH|nr:HD domain-containing protein [Nitrosopumilus cobalaminigenes]QLH02528.1 phosphohydrolase [Nitrosopumilus cobalaminigenes]